MASSYPIIGQNFTVGISRRHLAAEVRGASAYVLHAEKGRRILWLEWAKRRQDDPNEDIKSLKVPKSSIYKKCDSSIGKPYFSRLGGPQDEHKRLRKAPKRHLKSLKTSKERVPKMEPNKN